MKDGEGILCGSYVEEGIRVRTRERGRRKPWHAREVRVGDNLEYCMRGVGR
jgi:hypothetical protein